MRRLLGFPADSELHLAKDAERTGGWRNNYVYMVEVFSDLLIKAPCASTWYVQPGLSHLLFLLLPSSAFDFNSGLETHELQGQDRDKSKLTHTGPV